MQRADLSALAIFAAVAARRNFRAAAADLGLSPSAVSHAVGSLEDRLAIRLLARTTRSVALTEAGRALLGRIGPALAEIEEAVASLDTMRSAPAGLLRLTLPRTAAQQIIVPRLGDFAQAYPDIVVELQAEEGFVDIVAEGFDAGLRFGESLDKDMVALRIGPPQRLILVASPSWLARVPPPRHPRDLVALPCIALRFPSGALYRWEFEKDGEAIEVSVEGPVVLNDGRLVVEAAIAGAGLGFVFESLACDALEKGALVTLLDDWCPSFPGFFLYYPTRRQMRPALRAFVDFFIRR